MRVFIDLPEPGVAAEVWALDHPAVDGLVFIGTGKPAPGSVLTIGSIPLKWTEDMLVKAHVTCSAWHRAGEPAPQCGVCGFPNDAHSPDCLILLEAQGRVTLKDVTTDHRRQ